MNEIAEIRERILRIAAAGRNAGAVVLTAEVLSVYGASCDVKLGELMLTGVRYFSQTTEAGNILLMPKVGSMVTILADQDLRDLQVIQADKITSVKFEENGLVIEYDSVSGKVDIKNGQVSLKGLFQAVADIIKQLTVPTPAGPSGTPLPTTLTKVTQFETSFKQLLK